MEREYNEMRVYRVWAHIEGHLTESFFTSKTEAQDYVNYLNYKYKSEVAYLNKWPWSMMIEK